MDDRIRRPTGQEASETVIVLDASALLALIFREPGHERVARHVGSAIMSSVNLVEVLARLSRAGRGLTEAHENLSPLGIRFVAFDDSQALLAAGWREQARLKGMSMSDCACLALAAAQKLPVLTADRIWKSLSTGIAIEIIR